MRTLRFALCSAILATAAPVRGQFVWTSGDLSALNIPLNTLTSLQTLQIDTGADHDMPGQTLTNHGTITWNMGYIRGNSGSQIVIGSTGVFNDANSNSYSIYNSGSSAFDFINNGSYVRNTTGTTFIDIPFINNGTLTLSQGVIRLRGGGSLAGTGSVSLASGTQLIVTSGWSIASGATISGAGTFEHHGGTLAINGTTTLANFHHVSGLVSGSHTFASGSTYNWSAGSLVSTTGETTVIASGATLNILTGSDHDLAGRTLTNQGTVNWHSGYIRPGNGTDIVNAAGATFNDLNSSGYTVYAPTGSATFVNHGTYNRNVSGTTFFDIPFFNDGSVNIQQGSLQLRAGGTLASSGTINAASGTSVIFTNGFTVQSGASLAGAGQFQLSGGTLDVTGDINVGSFRQNGGLLAGTNAIASGTFNWENGSWSAAAAGSSTVIKSGATLNILTGADHDFNYRPVTNQGIVNWHQGYIRGGNGGNFTNAAGATFNDLNASGYTAYNPFGGTFSFINNGSYIRNVSGTTLFDIPFINTGSVDLQQGSIHFRAGGTLSSTGTITAAAGTSVVFTDGFTIDNSASLSGAGTFQLSSGTLTMNGIVDVGAFTQTGGLLAGTNTIDSGSVFNWMNGSWSAGAVGPQTTIASGATLNIATGADHDFMYRAVRNEGVVNWTSGYIRSGNGGTFINAAGATFNDLNASGYSVYNPVGGSFSFNNDGNYIRNVSGTTFFDVPFNNNSSLSLLQGSIQFRGGGTMASSGSISAASGTSVNFTNSYTVQSGSSLSGAGSYILSGGTFTIDGAVSVGSFVQTGGTLAGTHSINSGAFTWSNGVWTAATEGFVTTIGPAATLNINTGADHDFIRRDITNQGTTNWNAGYIRGGLGSSFTNAAGATFIDSNVSGYSMYNPSGGDFYFLNQGTYERVTTGTSPIHIPFINEGTLSLDSGAISFQAPLSLASTSVLDFDIGGTSAGVGYGQIAYNSSLTLAGTLALDLRNGFESTISHTNVFTVLSLSSGTLSGSFANISSGSRLLTTNGYGTFRVDYGATSPFGASTLVLSDFQAVPEPSTWALLVLGTAAIAWRGRRKR